MPVDESVLALFTAGVSAIGTTTQDFDEIAWSRPVCGEWTASDLAGHVVTVIGWYHHWLDRGLAGSTEPLFGIEELSAETARALAELEPGTGPDRVATFTREADRYATRLREHWDAPFTYPRGLVTAGLHAGVAASEWHLHAWDFAKSGGAEYEPEHSEALYNATAACLMAATGGIRGRVGVRVAAQIARRKAWPDLLHRSGRG